MPDQVRANFTPIPKGFDSVTKEAIVQLHLSFVGLDQKDDKSVVPSRIPFSDQKKLKKFVEDQGLLTFELWKISANGAVKLGAWKPVKPNALLWDLMDYSARETLKTIFDYRADLESTQKKVNARKATLESLIKSLKDKIEKVTKMVGIETTNLNMYLGLITDLTNSNQIFKKERLQITDNSYDKELNEYEKRINTYSEKKNLVQISLKEHQSELSTGKTEIKKYEEELKKAGQARLVLEKFRQSRFIPTDQDAAIDYIARNAVPDALGTNATGYTSDVHDELDLSLSDVLGYFSAFPGYMSELGLVRELRIKATDLDQEGILEIRGNKTLTAEIETLLHQVVYEWQPNTGFFFPKCRKESGLRYVKGYLNLALHKEYALEQTTFEEVKFRSTHRDSNARNSDYTSGLFLIQNNATKSLDFSLPNGPLYLEDLLQGYRVDVSRNKGSWRSLHKRKYNFKVNTKEVVRTEDEGFVSANSASKAYELVMLQTKNGLVEVNLCQLESSMDPTPINIPAGLPTILLQLVLSNITEFNVKESGGQQTCILSVNKKAGELKGPEIDQLVKDVNAILEKNSTEFMHRSVRCDLSGRLYYKSLGQYLGEGKYDIETPSFLSSSLICHINGYSLSAPRLMGREVRAFYEESQAGQMKHLGAFLQYAKINNEVNIQPGTLPLLRIGDNYSVRCRLVLVGGISLPVENQESTYSINRTFLRQDPIGAPRLVMPEEYDSANNQIVSSSNYIDLPKIGDSELQLIIRQGIRSSSSRSYPKSCTRLIVPPSISWQLAEWLKMMDLNDRPNATIMQNTANRNMPVYSSAGETYKNTSVVKWEEGKGKYKPFPKLTDRVPYISDSMASYFVIEPIRLYGVDLVNSINFAQQKDPSAKIQAEYKTQLEGLKKKCRNQFFDKNGLPKCSFWNSKKPSDRKADEFGLLPWSLTIKEGSDTDITVSSAERKVIIKLKPGDDIGFAIRSFTTDPEQLRSLFYGHDHPELIKLGLDPKGKMVVLPERRFRCIHAVQNYDFQNPHIGEKPTATDADTPPFEVARSTEYPNDVLIFQSILSVAKVCRDIFLIAEWQELIDDVPEDQVEKVGSPLRVVDHYKKVFSYFDPGYYAFGNTLKKEDRKFPGNKINSPLVYEVKLNSDQLELNPGDNDERCRLYVNLQGKFLAFRHELGSAKALSIRYRIGGTSRFQPYYHEGKVESLSHLFNMQNTQWLGNKTQGYDNKLNATLCPQAPQVHSMISLFETKDRDKVFKGVRIYLKRPWYTSGFGEKLAVVIEGKSETNESIIETTIGRDSTTIGDIPASDFIRPDRIIPTEYLLPIENREQPAKAQIAAFPVFFDMSKKLWFSDIHIEAKKLENTYCPFVQLVIARFQSLAEVGAHLSLPIRCDFMQIYPGRTLTSFAGQIKIAASSIKKGYDSESNEVVMTEVKFWKVLQNHRFIQNNQDFLISDADLLGSPEAADFDGNGTFTINFDPSKTKAVIIKELEKFTNTDKDDIRTMRLLYSYVVEIK